MAVPVTRWSFTRSDRPTGRGLLGVPVLPMDPAEQRALDELRRRREARQRQARPV